MNFFDNGTFDLCLPPSSDFAIGADYSTHLDLDVEKKKEASSTSCTHKSAWTCTRCDSTDHRRAAVPSTNENSIEISDDILVTSPMTSKIEKRIKPIKGRFICPERGCRKSYTRGNKLKCHISSAHRGNKPFLCSAESCSRRFSSKSDRDRHEDIHYDLPPDHVCQECGHEFRRHDSLLAHQRKHCSGIRGGSEIEEPDRNDRAIMMKVESQLQARSNAKSCPPYAREPAVLVEQSCPVAHG